MNIILTHPVHGKKVAISEMEVEEDRKYGWTPVKDKSVDNQTTNELEVRRRRKQDET